MAQVSNDVVNGVKLRGDGTVDDTQPRAVGAPRRAGLDDLGPKGLKLRGDGTVDDTQPGVARRPNDDIGADGLKRRGDGSIDDNQPGLGRGPVEDRSRRERFVQDGKRIERGFDADGNLIRERIRDDHSGRGSGDRNDGSGRGERSGHGDHDDRSDHMARNNRPERGNSGHGGG
jgi:hypothetical protein